MILPALYHWSPATRRRAIHATGLLPYSESAVASNTQPYTSLSPSPSSAWGLSGDMEWMGEEDEWDLWQVRLVEGDEVHIRPDFGPVIREVKVYTPIPADRVWWVGTRAPRLFDAEDDA